MLLWLANAALAATFTVGVDAPSVQAAVDQAVPGDVIRVPEGDWPGPVRVDKAVRIEGTGGALVSRSSDHTLVLAAPGVSKNEAGGP